MKRHPSSAKSMYSRGIRYGLIGALPAGLEFIRAGLRHRRNRRQVEAASARLAKASGRTFRLRVSGTCELVPRPPALGPRADRRHRTRRAGTRRSRTAAGGRLRPATRHRNRTRVERGNRAAGAHCARAGGGPCVRVELMREGGEHNDPIQTDISRERFRELWLVAGERVFIRPRRFDLFPSQLH